MLFFSAVTPFHVLSRYNLHGKIGIENSWGSVDPHPSPNDAPVNVAKELHMNTNTDTDYEQQQKAL